MQVYRIFYCFCHNILASFCGLNSELSSLSSVVDMTIGYYVANGTCEKLKNRYLLSGVIGSNDNSGLDENNEKHIGTLRFKPSYMVIVPILIQYGGNVQSTASLRIDVDGKMYVNSPVGVVSNMVASFVAIVYT